MSQTRDGGKLEKKELPYSPPQGPMGQSHQGPVSVKITTVPAVPKDAIK